MVRDGVIEEKPFGTVLYGGHPLPADVEQVALLKISELAICFWAVKEWSFIPICLSGDMGRGDGKDQDQCVCSPQHAGSDC